MVMLGRASARAAVTLARTLFSYSAWASSSLARRCNSAALSGPPSGNIRGSLSASSAQNWCFHSVRCCSLRGRPGCMQDHH